MPGKSDASIRLATGRDETRIRECAEDAYRRFVEAIGRKPAPMVSDFATQIAESRIYVIEDARGHFAGFIVFYPRGDGMFLENVAVRTSRQGQGFGRRLIDHCEAEAARMRLGFVELYTNEKMTSNLSLYPRLGYTETGRRDEDGFRRVYFKKRIG